MSKNIVILCDGTWCDPEDNTNVNIFRQLCVDDESQSQIIFYDSGIGTKWYNRIRGGIFGNGLSNNVKEAYKFLAKNYEKGDKVYLLGYSRGAYTVRSLAGFIYKCGLLKKTFLKKNKKKFTKKINQLYTLYKKDRQQKMKKQKSINIKCPVEFVGVWDTVGALGIPIYFLKKPSASLFQFHDTQINPEIANAYQAVSIDDQREAFEHTPLMQNKSIKNNNQSITEVWFPGVHGDVGGGKKKDDNTPDRSHSDLALKWMIDNAQKCGVKFKADLDGYEFKYDITREHTDNYSPIFGSKIERKIKDGAKVHKEVLKKIKALKSYTPVALHRKLNLSDRDNLTTLAPYSEYDNI